jgi:hypothetical protein
MKNGPEKRIKSCLDLLGKPILENAKNYIYCRCVELHCAPPRGAPGFLFCCSPCQPGQQVDYADPLPESSELFIDYRLSFLRMI